MIIRVLVAKKVEPLVDHCIVFTSLNPLRDGVRGITSVTGVPHIVSICQVNMRNVETEYLRTTETRHKFELTYWSRCRLVYAVLSLDLVMNNVKTPAFAHNGRTYVICCLLSGRPALLKLHRFRPSTHALLKSRRCHSSSQISLSLPSPRRGRCCRLQPVDRRWVRGRYGNIDERTRERGPESVLSPAAAQQCDARDSEKKQQHQQRHHFSVVLPTTWKTDSRTKAQWPAD